MNITLVHNPRAGLQQLPKEKLLESLSGKGIEITYISSKDDGFNETLLAHPGDLVVVAGGDGTVRKIAHLLLGKHIPIAVMPLGTANNISKTLEQSMPVAHANEQWMNLKTRPFDVGLVKFRGEKEFFVESMGCGAVAEMIYRFEHEEDKKKPKFNQPQEEINYIQSFMKDMLQDYQACQYDIMIDDQAYSGKYLLVEVMNIKSVGPHLWLAPDADPGDGWLDIALVHEHEKHALYAYLSRLEQGQAEPPGFTVKQGKNISITAHCTRFHIDDEVLPGKQMQTSEDAIQLDIQVQNYCLSVFEHSFKLDE